MKMSEIYFNLRTLRNDPINWMPKSFIKYNSSDLFLIIFILGEWELKYLLLKYSEVVSKFLSLSLQCSCLPKTCIFLNAVNMSGEAQDPVHWGPDLM